MIKQVLWFPAVLLAVAAAPCNCLAAPLQRADVAADPGLVLHLDFDAVRSTTVGKALLDQLNKSDINDQLSAFSAIFSFDPRTQLHGLTVYTTAKTPQEGVLLIYAEFDSNRVLNLGKLAPGFHTLTNGSHLIHTWLDEKESAKSGNQSHIFAAIQGNRLILGKGEQPVADALDVMDGISPNLAADKSMPELDAASGDFLQAMVRKFDFAGKDPNAAIFKMSKSLRLRAGEAHDQLSATLKVEAADTNVATQMYSVAQGLVALLKIQQDQPDALKLANALSLKQDGVTVSATITIPTADAVRMVKAGAAEKEHKQAEATNSASAQ
jgi:hypothetical protein